MARSPAGWEDIKPVAINRDAPISIEILQKSFGIGPLYPRASAIPCFDSDKELATCRLPKLAVLVAPVRVAEVVHFSKVKFSILPVVGREWNG
jgi:hypothetical protein